MFTENRINITGRLFSHTLERKEGDSGEYIVGEVSVEVDEEGTVVTARFFQTPIYKKSGKANRSYAILEEILDGTIKSIQEDGEEANWVNITGSIDISYFEGRNGADTIEDLSRAQKIRGVFISTAKKHIYSATWSCDLLITKVIENEADDERNIKHNARVLGYMIDDYREMFVEYGCNAFSEAAINYLLSLPVSFEEPFYTKVSGTFRKEIFTKVTESAFGESKKVEYPSLFWDITWMPANPYTFGEDITKETFDSYLETLNEKKEETLKANSDDEDALIF